MFSGATAATAGMTRRLACGLAVLLAAACLTVAGPGVGTADAVTLGCAGRLAKTVPFATGELRIYKSRQYACAITVAKKPGARRSMSVTLQARGGRAATEKGRFARQAGPVTVHALNRCVRASGAVAGHGGGTGWILC